MTLKQARKIVTDSKLLITAEDNEQTEENHFYVILDYLEPSDQFTPALQAVQSLERRKNRVTWIHHNRAQDCIEIKVALL